MQITITFDVRSVVLGLVSLIGFGVIYNAWVAGLERRGHDRGYTALLVAGGCSAAIVVIGLITWSLDLANLLALCFVACGGPMILGSLRRFWHARAVEERDSRTEAQEALPNA